MWRRFKLVIYSILYCLLVVVFIRIFIESKNEVGLDAILYPLLLAPLFVGLISILSFKLFGLYKLLDNNSNKQIYLIDHIFFYGSIVYILTVIIFDEYSYFLFKRFAHTGESWGLFIFLILAILLLIKEIINIIKFFQHR